MVNHEAIVAALRAHLDTLSVASLTATISATSSGYARASGDFVADGFAPGMELVASGFALSGNNGRKTIKAASATALTVAGTASESAGSRTLAVGLPLDVASENVRFESDPTRPYVKEEYIEGTLRVVTSGAGASLEGRPLYILKVHVPENLATLGLRRYVDALLSHFPPGQPFTVAGQGVNVSRDVPPSVGGLRNIGGFAVKTVTVPLFVSTVNAI